MSQPKITPDIPTVTLPYGAVNHTPRPATTQMIAVTETNRPIPFASTRKPKTTNGRVFAMRCAHPACSRGAHTMPSRPSTLRGTIPSASSRSPVIWS